MKRIGALVTAILFSAQAPPPKRPGHRPRPTRPGKGRGATFWTGVGLLGGGLGLTAFAAARSHDCGSMMRQESVGMMRTPGAMNAMMQGTSHHSGHGDLNALAIGVGVAAATTGLVLVLVSSKDRRPSRSVLLRPGIGQVALVYSF